MSNTRTHPPVAISEEEKQQLRLKMEKVFSATTLEDQAEAWSSMVWGLLPLTHPVQTYTPLQLTELVGAPCPQRAMEIYSEMHHHYDFYTDVDQNVAESVADAAVGGSLIEEFDLDPDECACGNGCV